MNDKYITIISLKYQPGSAITNRLLNLVKGLNEHDVKVRCVFLNPNKTREKLYSYENTSFNFLYENQHSYLQKNKYLSFLFSIYILLKTLKKGDKVLIVEYFFPLFFLLSFKRVFLYQERTENPDLFFHNKRFIKWLYLKQSRKSAGIFVISKNLINYFINHGVSKDKLTLINITVDPQRFINLKKESNVDEYIAYCGTVSETKDGVDYLIKAFKLISKENPNIKLFIIGGFATEIDRRNIECLVKKLEISEKVVFTGKITPEEMPRYLKNAKILALARPDNNQAKAGFPTKLGEYLMTANPVVVTRVGEIDQFLVDLKHCIFANPNDEDDFARKLVWVLQNYNEALKIGEQGKAVALSEFSYDTQSKKVFNAIFN